MRRQHQCQRNANQFHHETERLFLHLCQRLQQTDAEPDKRCQQNGRQRQRQHHGHGFGRKIDDNGRIHCIYYNRGKTGAQMITGGGGGCAEDE